MTFGQQIRTAGGVICIAAFFMNNVPLTAIGLIAMALGAMWQVDSLERRVTELESKEATKDETNA